MVCLLLIARVDRYNHEIEAEDTEEDAEDIMFNSFSSCSPRYNRVYQKFEELREVREVSNCMMLFSGECNPPAVPVYVQG